MIKVIHHSTLKLIIFLGLTSLLTGCKTNSALHLKDYETKVLELPTGESFKIYLARTPSEQVTGLSGIQDKDFPQDAGMFFTGDTHKFRQFWMPETFFNLDIIFLSDDLYVLDIHRNLQHYVETEPKNIIPRSKKVMCTHVLELKADSAISKKIQHGMILKWNETTKIIKN